MEPKKKEMMLKWTNRKQNESQMVHCLQCTVISHMQEARKSKLLLKQNLKGLNQIVQVLTLMNIVNKFITHIFIYIYIYIYMGGGEPFITYNKLCSGLLPTPERGGGGSRMTPNFQILLKSRSNSLSTDLGRCLKK